jgi:hypothetical protein
MGIEANGESGKRADTPARLEGMIDLNLLPQRYRRRWPRPSTVLAWLLMFILLGALYYSYQAFETANRHYAEQRTDLATAREELEASDPVSEQIAQLRTEIEAERQRAQALERAATALDGIDERKAYLLACHEFATAQLAAAQRLHQAPQPDQVVIGGVGRRDGADAALAWRASFPRHKAIDALRNAIIATRSPGLT